MNTNTYLKLRILSIIAGLGAGLVPAPAQSVAVEPGDLLLGFLQINPSGTGVEANTCVLNVGAGSMWRENTNSPVLIGNINADLENAFGPGWYDDPNLRCGIVGVVGSTEPLTAGDPARTTYFSQGLTTFAAGTTVAPVLSSSRRGSLSTKILTFKNATKGVAAGANPAAAVIGTSENSNFATFLPPLVTTYFGIGESPLASFGPGTIGAAEGYDVEAGLDVYRILHSTSGADLTAGMSPGDAVVGTGQLIGMFTIDAAGNVRHDVPDPTPADGYSAWADANLLAGADREPGADADKDRIANGVEFVTGGNPSAGGDAGKLPEVSYGGGFIEFAFRRTDASAYLNPEVEYSADLKSGWTVAENGVGGVTVTEDDGFYGASTDKVTVRIPVSGERRFVRLKVTFP